MEIQEEKDAENKNHVNDDFDLEKMKGDAIGDTVYSERYVLKVLIQLSQYDDEKWNDEFESDVCILWDMTATSAVVHFLMLHDSLDLITSLLRSTSNPRLLEILVGILGNMCCVKEVRDIFGEDPQLCELLLQLLACPDPPTLVQLTRCLQSFAWDLLRGDATLVVEQHWLERQIVSGQVAAQLAFILSSSLCEELLTAVLELLNTLCGLELNDKDYSRYFATTDMLDGMLECWDQLFLGCKEGSKFEFTNKHLEKSALQWVSVLLALAGHENGRELIGHRAKQITGAVLNWIQEPDNSDALLITTISLLEALVSFYFCQDAFCKTIHIVRKTTERNADDEERDKEDMTVLNLKESFGNYCMEVLKCLERKFLDSILIKCCNDKSINFFWRIVEEREPDLILPSDRSR